MPNVDTRIDIHLVNAVIPELQHEKDTRRIEPNTKMRFDDSALQCEDVTVIAGPLMVATSDSVFYLIQFEDNSLYLSYPGDLHDRPKK